LILEPLGLHLEFSAGDGPVLANPVRTADDVDRLRELESMAELEFVVEAVRQTRAGLNERLPLICFAGAPFTLAAYIIEGGASRDYRHTKTLMYADPAAWDALMSRIARAVTLYLNAQIDAGAQIVQLFDSWAGCLGVDDYSQHVLPYSKYILSKLRPNTPTIHFGTGNPALLPLFAEAGGSVIGVDWRSRLDAAAEIVGPQRALQGNLDPTVLLTTPDEVRRQTLAMLRQMAGRPGYIANLGHGVLTHTPVENVMTMIETVQNWKAG